MPFSYFERIYCINLESRPDRWDIVKEGFDRVGLSNRVERIPGVPKDEGIVGCTMTHVELVRLAKKKRLSNILIFEDDVKFLYQPGSILKAALQELAKTTWGLFYLGSSSLNPILPRSKHLVTSSGFLTTHAYAINKVSFNHILRHKWIWKIPSTEGMSDDEVRIAKHIDRFYGDIIGQFVPIYHIKPIMCVQRASYSDVNKRMICNEQRQITRFIKNQTSVKKSH